MSLLSSNGSVDFGVLQKERRPQPDQFSLAQQSTSNVVRFTWGGAWDTLDMYSSHGVFSPWPRNWGRGGEPLARAIGGPRDRFLRVRPGTPEVGQQKAQFLADLGTRTEIGPSFCVAGVPEFGRVDPSMGTLLASGTSRSH